jgi:uncharacterized linocin/CFP29 family protein
MNLPAEITWTEEVKKRINDAVAEEVSRIRICQKVFPTHRFTSTPLDVLVDTVELPPPPAGTPLILSPPATPPVFPPIRIPEGVTRQFVQLNSEFEVTVAQARNEPERRICQTLSRMAAKSIALAEDAIIFHGEGASTLLPALRVTPHQLGSAAQGLLGAADPRPPNAPDDNDPDRVSEPIDVDPLPGSPPSPHYGERVFTAVADGIAKLVRKGQAPNYALFLPTRVYADTFVPPGHQSLVTTAERIRPLVEGGFFGTGVLPEHQGLLVALGGQPTVIYMGEEAEVEYVRRDRVRYFFCVTERVQFVARDPRALVLLRFN